MGDDEVPRYLTREDAWGGTVMRRLDDGWCAALDRETRLCTIYQRRPGVCRDYEMGIGDCLIEFVRLLPMKDSLSQSAILLSGLVSPKKAND